MGLDMYLYQVEQEATSYIHYDVYEVKTTNSELYMEMKPYLKLRGTPGVSVKLEMQQRAAKKSAPNRG